MVDLVVAPCSHEAAKYAVMKWHYSKAMPAGKLVKFGAWENGKFIGAVIFGRGATYDIGTPYGLKQTECIELVRVALSAHNSPVSQIVTKTIKAMQAEQPGLRLIVSYADSEQGHFGGIYQAMNWIYAGTGKGDFLVLLNGKWVHRRNAHCALGTSKGLPRKAYSGRYKYLYPLDKAMRRQIEPLAKPYPKRADVGEIESRDDTIV
jgi:hypothetical protein